MSNLPPGVTQEMIDRRGEPCPMRRPRMVGKWPIYSVHWTENGESFCTGLSAYLEKVIEEAEKHLGKEGLCVGHYDNFKNWIIDWRPECLQLQKTA